MFRTLICAILLVTVATSSVAGIGVNLYGLSYHPDRDETSTYGYNETNWGLGLQYDLVVGARSRLYLQGGGLSDSLENLNLHGGISYRHQAWGPLWAGASLFITGTKSDYDGEPVAGALPFLAFVTKPVELSWTYLPDASGRRGTGGILMYATVFPAGRTESDRGTRGYDDRTRRGFEFGLSPEAGLMDFRGVSFVYRQVDPQWGGHRFGAEFGGRFLDSERSGGTRENEADDASSDVTLFWDRLTYHGTSRSVRLMTGGGVFMGHSLDSSYSRAIDSEDYLSESWGERISWSAGLRGSLGMEWRVLEDLVLTANSHLSVGYRRTRAVNTYASDSIQEGRQVSTTYDVSIVSSGASLGVVLYYD